MLRLGQIPSLAPLVSLPDLAPHHHASVEVTVQNLPHAGRSPRPTWTTNATLVQQLGDLREAQPASAQPEYLPNDLGLLRVDPALNMQATVAVLYLYVDVAVGAIASDVSGPGLLEQSIAGPLPSLVTLQFVSKGSQREHDLVGGIVQYDLSLP
ncbi:MAG: hypothetical protein V3U14_08495 [candidate division NC10 bacterium]